MRDAIFLNKGLSYAFTSYLSNLNNPDSIEYNSFLSITIRLLELIYGSSLIDAYKSNDSLNFKNILQIYTYPLKDIEIFLENIDCFFKFDQNNSKQLPNPYFKAILLALYDMFIAKKESIGISFTEEEKFLELAYTTSTKEPYQISYLYIQEENPLYFEKYYYSKINNLDVTKEFDISQTIIGSLNLEALGYVGVTLNDLTKMNNEEIKNAQKKTYQYFNVDLNSPTKDQDLIKALKDKQTKSKIALSTGNGYVDILLLMSIITTTISLILIVVLKFI